MRDITERLARRLRDRLEPGETVLAGVALNAKGTFGAALAGGAKASGEVAGVAADGKLAKVRSEHEALGARGVRFYFLLTDARVVLVRRNAVGMAAEVTFSAPVTDVAELLITRRSSNVALRLRDGRALALETPKDPKFLPPVYLELPDRLATARAARD